MNLFHFNDYELLYLIYQGSDEALEIMFAKYQPLIKSRTNKFTRIQRLKEDYNQEGRLILNKAIRVYREDSVMSFTKFFDLLLQRRYIDLRRKEQKTMDCYILKEEIDEISAEPRAALLYEEEEFTNTVLSDLEKNVYILKYVKHYKDEAIARTLEVDIRQVYNASDRIKKKMKKKYKK